MSAFPRDRPHRRTLCAMVQLHCWKPRTTDSVAMPVHTLAMLASTLASGVLNVAAHLADAASAKDTTAKPASKAKIASGTVAPAKPFAAHLAASLAAGAGSLAAHRIDAVSGKGSAIKDIISGQGSAAKHALSNQSLLAKHTGKQKVSSDAAAQANALLASLVAAAASLSTVPLAATSNVKPALPSGQVPSSVGATVLVPLAPVHGSRSKTTTATTPAGAKISLPSAALVTVKTPTPPATAVPSIPTVSVGVPAHATPDSLQAAHVPVHATPDSIQAPRVSAHVTPDSLQTSHVPVHATPDSLQASHVPVHATPDSLQAARAAATPTVPAKPLSSEGKGEVHLGTHTTVESPSPEILPATTVPAAPIASAPVPAHATPDSIPATHVSAPAPPDSLPAARVPVHATPDSIQAARLPAHATPDSIQAVRASATPTVPTKTLSRDGKGEVHLGTHTTVESPSAEPAPADHEQAAATNPVIPRGTQTTIELPSLEMAAPNLEQTGTTNSVSDISQRAFAAPTKLSEASGVADARTEPAVAPVSPQVSAAPHQARLDAPAEVEATNPAASRLFAASSFAASAPATTLALSSVEPASRLFAKPAQANHDAAQLPAAPSSPAPGASVATTFAAPTVAPVSQTSPAAAPATAPVADQLTRAFIAQAEVVQRDGRTDFHLRLDPPQLGSVQIHLRATEHTVSARIVVAQEGTRQLLESQAQQLRQGLEQAGLSLGSFDVTRDGGGSHGGGQQAPPHTPFSLPTPLASPRATAPDSTTVMRPTDGINILA